MCRVSQTVNSCGSLRVVSESDISYKWVKRVRTWAHERKHSAPLFLFQVSTEMINYYDSMYDKAMVQSVQEPDKMKAAALVLKLFHETVRKKMTSVSMRVFDICLLMKRDDDCHPKKFTKCFAVFQLTCCGKGQGTTFLTHITDKLGLTDLCPSSETYFVSLKTQQISSAQASNTDLKSLRSDANLSPFYNLIWTNTRTSPKCSNLVACMDYSWNKL